MVRAALELPPLLTRIGLVIAAIGFPLNLFLAWQAHDSDDDLWTSLRPEAAPAHLDPGGSPGVAAGGGAAWRIWGQSPPPPANPHGAGGRPPELDGRRRLRRHPGARPGAGARGSLLHQRLPARERPEGRERPQAGGVEPRREAGTAGRPAGGHRRRDQRLDREDRLGVPGLAPGGGRLHRKGAGLRQGGRRVEGRRPRRRRKARRPRPHGPGRRHARGDAAQGRRDLQRRLARGRPRLRARHGVHRGGEDRRGHPALPRGGEDRPADGPGLVGAGGGRAEPGTQRRGRAVLREGAGPRRPDERAREVPQPQRLLPAQGRRRQGHRGPRPPAAEVPRGQRRPRQPGRGLAAEARLQEGARVGAAGRRDLPEEGRPAQQPRPLRHVRRGLRHRHPGAAEGARAEPRLPGRVRGPGPRPVRLGPARRGHRHLDPARRLRRRRRLPRRRGARRRGHARGAARGRAGAPREGDRRRRAGEPRRRRSGRKLAMLGSIHLATGQPAKALAAAERARKATSADHVLFQVGTVFLGAGDDRKAARHRRRAREAARRRRPHVRARPRTAPSPPARRTTSRRSRR